MRSVFIGCCGFVLVAFLFTSSLIGQTRERAALLARFDDAVELIAQGERGRQELEVGATAADQADAVRQVLRQAATQLEAIEKEIRNELPLRRRAASGSGGLSADELSRLSEQVQYQLARVSTNRALLFPPGSDDRVSLLLAARNIFEKTASQVPSGEPLKESIQLDLAECHRLLGHYEQAVEAAKQLAGDAIPVKTRHRARAVLIRAAIGLKDFDSAIRLATLKADEAAASPDFELARFEAFLRAGCDADGSPQSSKELHKRSAEIAKTLENSHGAYWALRANQLVATALAQCAIINAELLAQAADSLYLTGDVDKAIAAYEGAAAQARSENDFKPGFEWAYKAALIEQKLARHVAAAGRLRNLAKNQTMHPLAAQAHLLAVWNAAQAATRDTPSAGLYEELLREHLSSWPNTESADQVRLWLGAVNESKHQWQEAIEIYSGIPRTSPHAETAAKATARCRTFAEKRK